MKRVRRILSGIATALLGLFIMGILGLCFLALVVLSVFYPPGERWLRPKEKS